MCPDVAIVEPKRSKTINSREPVPLRSRNCIFSHVPVPEFPLCVAESDELETPDIQTAPFASYRLRRSGYTREQLESIASTLRRRAAEGEVFASLKHEDETTGAISAAETLQRFR